PPTLPVYGPGVARRMIFVLTLNLTANRDIDAAGGRGERVTTTTDLPRPDRGTRGAVKRHHVTLGDPPDDARVAWHHHAPAARAPLPGSWPARSPWQRRPPERRAGCGVPRDPLVRRADVGGSANHQHL